MSNKNRAFPNNWENMQKKAIFTTLYRGGFIQPDQATLLSGKCRDLDIQVFRDNLSQVVYLDPSYSGRAVDYYMHKNSPSTATPRNDMDIVDTLRRSELLRPFIANKSWLDFGCGMGYQLKQDAALSKAHLGVELNIENVRVLQSEGLSATSDLEDSKEFQPELISLFHVLEHLDDPVNTLCTLREYSAPNARLVLEVPHARDWLLLHGPSEFRDFTLWSEHLVLHTRESLAYIVRQAGWQLQQICAVQRYPVWNHLTWFQKGLPSGVGGTLNDATSHHLHQAYEAYLGARDQTDTLIAFAFKDD